MVDEIVFAEVPVDWSYALTLHELEAHIGAMLVSTEQTIDWLGTPRASFKFQTEDYISHSDALNEIKDFYEKNGFATRFVMQDPFSHKGATAACPIGFPFNLPKAYPELRRFNRWICRVHVDIAKHPDQNILISVPHIEPDPTFHKLAHIWDSYIKRNIVRGKTAVELLKYLLNLK